MSVYMYGVCVCLFVSVCMYVVYMYACVFVSYMHLYYVVCVCMYDMCLCVSVLVHASSFTSLGFKQFPSRKTSKIQQILNFDKCTIFI